MSSTDKNFKEKNVWIATLHAAGVVDQTENTFLDSQTLTVVPPSHLKYMQYEDEQIDLVVKLKNKYHQELTKKERMLQTPEVKNPLQHRPKLTIEDDLLLSMSPFGNHFFLPSKSKTLVYKKLHSET